MLLPTFLGSLVALSWAAPQISIGPTTLVGRDVTGLKQDFFGGIPFASPPVGELRLQPPVLQTSLPPGTLDASNFGAACLQLDGAQGIPSAAQSEDCLTLNIFRPSGTPANASLPVLFWTYGGGFTAGSALIYNGSAIVAQSVARGTPIIYVNFNYRLGPLGFPQGEEADRAGILNLALKDQLAALAWVQVNIGLFGGDKHRVTVFGQSAGAVMTSILYFNSPLDTLARGTILQSGFAATAPVFNASRQERVWQAFVAGTPSCVGKVATTQTLECLRYANSSDITLGLRASLNSTQDLFAVQPTLDGPKGLFPDLPSRLLSQGKFAHIPFIAGTNLDEGTAFIPRSINSTEQIRGLFAQNLSPPIPGASSLEEATTKILQLYPDDPAVGSPFGTGNETFGLSSIYKQASAIFGDLAFQSQRRALSQAASAANLTNFGYIFTEPQPAQASAGHGVFHGADVPFVYGVPPNTTQSALELSKYMIDYWISFTVSLNPNDGHGYLRPTWTPYTANHTALMQLNGAALKLLCDDYRSEQIAFFNSEPEVFHHRRSD